MKKVLLLAFLLLVSVLIGGSYVGYRFFFDLPIDTTQIIKSVTEFKATLPPTLPDEENRLVLISQTAGRLKQILEANTPESQSLQTTLDSWTQKPFYDRASFTPEDITALKTFNQSWETLSPELSQALKMAPGVYSESFEAPVKKIILQDVLLLTQANLASANWLALKKEWALVIEKIHLNLALSWDLLSSGNTVAIASGASILEKTLGWYASLLQAAPREVLATPGMELVFTDLQAIQNLGNLSKRIIQAEMNFFHDSVSLVKSGINKEIKLQLPRYYSGIFIARDYKIGMNRYLKALEFLEKIPSPAEAAAKIKTLQEEKLPPLTPITALTTLSLEKWIVKMATAQTFVDIINTALSLAHYASNQNTYPQKLEDLITAGNLGALPTNPLNPGTSLLYQKTDTGYLLYGVGDNGQDDGGQDPQDTLFIKAVTPMTPPGLKDLYTQAELITQTASLVVPVPLLPSDIEYYYAGMTSSTGLYEAVIFEPALHNGNPYGVLMTPTTSSPFTLRLGLAQGDIITGLDGQPVVQLSETGLIEMLKTKGALRMLVIRDNALIQYDIQITHNDGLSVSDPLQPAPVPSAPPSSPPIEAQPVTETPPEAKPVTSPASQVPATPPSSVSTPQESLHAPPPPAH